ncbi:MAG: IS3 family transposase, partial [Acidobacteria bacterium]|nr:IS3 family transposase [Acidobacteriota bacterium]
MKLQPDYPIKLLCDLPALSRSSWYFKAAECEEADLKQAIEQVIKQFPAYGSRRVTHRLRRDQSEFRTSGRKRLRRVLGEMDLKLRRKTIKKQTTDSRHSFPRDPNLVKELEILRPEQVWVGDITYVRLGDGSFVYLAILMDVFTRIIRDWALSRGLGGELTLAARARALSHARPEIHHSDQGVQSAATACVAALKKRKVKVSMAAVGHAEENGYAERVSRTIKAEEVALNEYPDLLSAQLHLRRFIDDVYHTKRIHSSLGYLTPAEFAAQ